MEEFEDIIYKINIKDIKSSFIIKRIFLFLYEKQKLSMIIFNKEIQMKCQVDIEDYKKISGKYKIGGINGKGIEYILYTNYLVFEGEYLNKKRNGKGKEYFFNKLIFEGEYLNGKRNGKGKEYYEDGKPLFEGEYLNGEKWNGKGYYKNGNIEFQIENGNGKGKEYNYFGELKFEGEYLNGKRKGKGKEYYFGKLEYEGEYLNGKKIRKGREYDYNGALQFEGIIYMCLEKFNQTNLL